MKLKRAKKTAFERVGKWLDMHPTRSISDACKTLGVSPGAFYTQRRRNQMKYAAAAEVGLELAEPKEEELEIKSQEESKEAFSRTDVRAFYTIGNRRVRVEGPPVAVSVVLRELGFNV